MRTDIIGDIHGCSTSLDSLLAQVKPIPGRDRLVFLGDLFDRGPDSFGVLKRIRNLKETFGEDCILLLGNHEDYLLQPQLSRRLRTIWEKVGRQATVESFLAAGYNMEEMIPWLQQHIRLFWRTDDFQCVHAGIVVHPPEVNDLWTLVHDHETVFKNQYNGPLTITGHVGLEKATWFTGNGETVTVLSENILLPLPDSGIICIDTGCGKGGRLTAMIIENKQYRLISAPENVEDQ